MTAVRDLRAGDRFLTPGGRELTVRAVRPYFQAVVGTIEVLTVEPYIPAEPGETFIAHGECTVQMVSDDLRDHLRHAEKNGGVVQITGPTGAGILDPEEIAYSEARRRADDLVEEIICAIVERVVLATSYDAIDAAISSTAVTMLGRTYAELGGGQHAFRVGNAARARWSELRDAFSGAVTQ